jgi:hypothetical protein
MKIILELKKLGWKAEPDWRIALKVENHVPLVKQIEVTNDTNKQSWNDQIETHIDLRLSTPDKITYFPEYEISANIFIEGGDIKDVLYTADAGVAFIDKDFQNKSKITLAAKKIDSTTRDQIESEYSNYLSSAATAIQQYRQGGWKADDFPER